MVGREEVEEYGSYICEIYSTFFDKDDRMSGSAVDSLSGYISWHPLTADSSTVLHFQRVFPALSS